MSSYHILRHLPEQGEAEPLLYVDQTPNKDTSYTDTEVEAGVLYVYRVKAIVNWMGDLGEASDAAKIRAPATAQEQTANNPATGAPTITGTVQVGETLTADTSGIGDDDGLTNAAVAYQWLADGADIQDATDSSYTLAEADEGKAISVKVSFTDDAGNAETLTSAATAAVEARPNSPATGEPNINGTAQVGETLTADTSGIADDDGLDNASFSYQWLADDSNISGATGETYTLADVDVGKAVSVTVSFTDGGGNEESLTSAATGAVEAKSNSPATGQPAISGTALVGETLTADTSGIADEDGLDSVSYSYQWLAEDVEISGATDSTYTLASNDVGRTIKVRVSFTDDRGHGEELASAATAVVEAAPFPPLTASLDNVATSHDGESVFTFELRFSEEFGLSYKTLRDHAFTVTGRSGAEGAAAGAGQRHRLADHGQAGRQRRRNRGPVRHHGLRQPGGHLHRGRQDAVPPAGADGQRAGPVGPPPEGGFEAAAKQPGTQTRKSGGGLSQPGGLLTSPRPKAKRFRLRKWRNWLGGSRRDETQAPLSQGEAPAGGSMGTAGPTQHLSERTGAPLRDFPGIHVPADAGGTESIGATAAAVDGGAGGE